MVEAFLILLAGGVMLATALSDPRAVTLQWLRLGGIVAISLLGVAGVFFYRRTFQSPDVMVMYWACASAVTAQLGFAQSQLRRTQRVFAVIAFVFAVLVGADWLGPSDRWFQRPYAQLSISLATAAGASAMSGLILMNMLLGHAYLTAQRMSLAPFRRLNLLCGVVLALRLVSSTVVVAMLAKSGTPTDRLWSLYLFSIGIRWLVGIVVPAVFVFMAHDCIKRQATQSATGILYVAGVLIFIGEIMALYLMTQTGLPF